VRLKIFTLALLTIGLAAQAPAQEVAMSDAQRIVEISYPPGSYAKSFSTGTREFYDKQAGPEAMRKLDPNSAERMRIIYKVIDEEAAKLGLAREPEVRKAMIAKVAAMFSAEEQRDIRAFLETPSGRSYAARIAGIADVLETPEQQAHMMVAMEEVSEKIEAATAHLRER